MLAMAVAMPRLAANPETAALFVKHCASCHGRDGKAKTPVARKLLVKDLTESQIPDAEIERQILEGNKDKMGNMWMPPFKEKVSAEEAKALAAWVKALRK